MNSVVLRTPMKYQDAVRRLDKFCDGALITCLDGELCIEMKRLRTESLQQIHNVLFDGFYIEPNTELISISLPSLTSFVNPVSLDLFNDRTIWLETEHET